MTTPEMKVRDSIATFRFAPDQWLWCLHCERFFQGRDARPDCIGGVQGCAFEHCEGAGHGVDIFEWNVWPEGMPAVKGQWPREEQLHKGLIAHAWPSEANDVQEMSLEDCARFGIGAALNGDSGRRDEILGTFTRADVKQVTPFRHLDLGRFEQLVAERFIPLDSTLGARITPRRVIEFIRRWPEVRAQGYSVHRDRPDYRVTITMLECDLDTVPLDDRDSLVEEFVAEFEGEGELMCSEECLMVWWD
jgi:hypothetical protein